MLNRLFTLATLCLLCAIGPAFTASAIPVVFRWDVTVPVNGSTFPEVQPGEVLEVLVFADNGGTDLLGQTWDNADINRTELAAGSYTGTITGVTAFGDPVFETDGSGNFTRTFPLYNNATGIDSLGGPNGITLQRNTLGTSAVGASLLWDFSLDGDLGDPAQWTATVVPEPSTALLVLLGLSGLGAAERRRVRR